TVVNPIETASPAGNVPGPVEAGTGEIPMESPAAQRIGRGSAARVPLGALVRACRPRQWGKNGLVLPAPAAAGVLPPADVPGKVALTFVCFCMLSSATYLFNDVRDREEDRRQPRRWSRPVASGELPMRVAVMASLALALGGLALAAVVRPALVAVAGGYLALTVTYTPWWRSIALADIAAAAGAL